MYIYIYIRQRIYIYIYMFTLIDIYINYLANRKQKVRMDKTFVEREGRATSPVGLNIKTTII